MPLQCDVRPKKSSLVHAVSETHDVVYVGAVDTDSFGRLRVEVGLEDETREAQHGAEEEATGARRPTISC